MYACVGKRKFLKHCRLDGNIISSDLPSKRLEIKFLLVINFLENTQLEPAANHQSNCVSKALFSLHLYRVNLEGKRCAFLFKTNIYVLQ